MRVEHQNAGGTTTHRVVVPRTTSADADPYPEGESVRTIVAWVNRAPEGRLRSERARAAITAEHDRDNPRPSLIQKLGPTGRTT